MSYLQNQLNSTRKTLASLGNKTLAAQPTSTPSPAATSSQNDRKRPRPDASAVVYSQPADTGTGKEIMTQVIYAIDYLKTKNAPLVMHDILSYLSLQYTDSGYKQTIHRILRHHDKVEYDPKGANGDGTFRFRPIHNIRTGDQLLKFLQSQPTAQGLNVRELRDGWPNVEETINDLESERKLLVTRNKKDDHAKMVWANDPSLRQHIDEEFRVIWEKIRVPDEETVTAELEKAGLATTSKSKIVKNRPKVEQKKTKKPRKGGKTTNTHMTGILRDYSHLKK